MSFPSKLRGSVWHTTSLERYKQIVIDKAILPEPPTIKDSERWKTGGGPEGYPYVRKLGGVSLFDFRKFDKDKYSQKYPFSSWRTFVPKVKDWHTAVWIKIDIKAVSENLIFGSELINQWKTQEAYRHSIMPIIEIAHIGPLPSSAFQKILTFSENDQCFRTIEP